MGAVTPPHDITGRVIGGYLPRHPDAAPLLDMMERSYALLSDHPINRARVAKGLPAANAIWLWGQGKRPRLGSFVKVTVTGCMDCDLTGELVE